MSSYWRAVPAFRLARQLYREAHGPRVAHRFFRDSQADMAKIFQAWPWPAHSERQKSFNEVCKRHWLEFAKEMDKTFGDGIEKDWWKEHTDKTVRVESEKVKTDSAAPAAEAGKDFEVALDLSGFAPEEISVKIIGNDILLVEARHEAKQADGSRVFRRYTREFVLPAGVDLDALKSSLDARGVLNLKAPDRSVPAERAVPIDVDTAGETSSEPRTEASADGDIKASRAEEADSSTAEKPQDKI